MSGKVIQVPMGQELLEQLDSISKTQKCSRAQLIREACSIYVTQLEEDMMDRAYREGYERLPESSALGEAQANLSGEVLSEETW